MRTASIGAMLALLLPACGGTPAALETAALQGTVYELDGQSLDLSGVSVTLLETGETHVTDPNGEFRFDALAPGVYTLDFDTTLTVAAMVDGESAGEPADDRPHDEAVEDEEGRPRVEVPEDGGEIDVRVKIEGGAVTDFSVGHHEERHAVGWLEPMADGLLVEGKVRLRAEGEVYELAVCVWGLEYGDTVTIWIGDDLVADPVANADGAAGFERLVENAATLVGRTVHVQLGGELILAGEIPALPPEMPPPDGDGHAEEPDKSDADGSGEPGGTDLPDGHEGGVPEEPGDAPDGGSSGGDAGTGEGTHTEEGMEGEPR